MSSSQRSGLLRLVSVLLAAVLMMCTVPLNAFATGAGQVVVVGASPDHGITRLDSEYAGFAYDYLTQMQRYTGHRYSFVEAESEELYQMLREGRIDVIPCVTTEEFDAHTIQTFSRDTDGSVEPMLNSISLMKKHTAIYVLDGNGAAPGYFDIEGINSAKIGYLAENKAKYFVDGKFIRGDIDRATFIEYSTETQMKEDFYSGKLDAVIKECFRTWNDEVIIYQFGTRDCYFMTSGQDPLLAGQLDVAMNAVNMSSPQFASELYIKHMSKYGTAKFAFSDAELRYITENPTITVAYDMSSLVVDGHSSGSSGISGVTDAMLNAIEQLSGMDIDVRICDSLEECVKLLENGSVQAICGGVNSRSIAAFGKFKISMPYSSEHIVVAAKPDLATTDYKKIAVPFYGDDIAKHAKSIYPSATILPCEDISACMEAVRNGEAEVCCAGAGETIYAINNGYGDLQLVGISSTSHDECFAYTQDSSAELSGIIGKCIARLKIYSEVITTYPDAVSGGAAPANSAAMSNVTAVVLAIAVVLALGGMLAMVIFTLKNKQHHQTDPLTGGRNKTRFYEDTKKLIKKVPAEKLAMVLFDINKFKFVNDRLGYEEGDRMLVRIHKTIADNVEADELFARLSDDNFAMIVRNTTDNDITARLNNIFAEFERRNALHVKYPVVFSAGVCRLGQCSEDGHDIDLNIALDRCKIAKRTLKGLHYSSIAFYDGKIRDKALREKDYETIMPVALEQREFECYLQPKYGLKSRHIEGAEALIRWNSKDFGFVFPNDFIPISEKNGFVVELDFYILEEVCRAMRRWIDDGKTPVVISVNQSRLHLNYDDYIWRLREIVDKYEIPYEYIELELTESVFMENADKLLAILQKLHDIGFKLSLDDFGSGYSSLNMLKDIPVDVVKIDREFFNGTVNSEKGRAVISTVVDLAKNLNMEVISEGVETLEQVEFLTEINCAMVQGYYFAKPMNMSAFEELWQKDMAEREAEISQIKLDDISTQGAEN